VGGWRGHRLKAAVESSREHGVPFLQILQTGGGGRVVRVATGDGEITIGRGEENDLVLEHSTVSRLHARVVSSRLGFLLLDEDSTNGMRVGGERVERHFLKHGDRIAIGAFELEFDAEGDALGQPRGEPEATVRQCASCGEPLQPGNLYCGRCGARLGASAAPPEQAAVSPGDVPVRASEQAPEPAEPTPPPEKPRPAPSQPREVRVAPRRSEPRPLRPGRVLVLAPGARRHRPGLALLAALFVPGAGQAYNGQTVKGFFLLFASVLVAPWVYSVFDARSRARAIVEAGGRLGRGGPVWIVLQGWLLLNVMLALAIGLTLTGVLR